jgi:diadenosine tetraphosphate (Ap4A) HIT family hydrolase
MDEICEYCQIEGGYGDVLFETSYWIIYLAPSQRYLGTCVVALKRHCKDLSQVEKNEWVDFGIIVQKLELALQKTFKPTLYNWSCFKNSTFRTKKPNPEIHWHFIPRYQDEVDFEGVKFRDQDFGYIPQPIKQEISLKLREKLVNAIMKHVTS